MTVRWKSYRIICILQLIIASFALMSSLINFFEYTSIGDVAGVILFLLMLLLAVHAIGLLNRNYPDTPVEGNQKKAFNRLFLFNFIFLAVLFGFIFAEFRMIAAFSRLTGLSVFKLAPRMFFFLIIYLLALVFQFVILYGLFVLRQLLYSNFRKKKFEFEEGV